MGQPRLKSAKSIVATLQFPSSSEGKSLGLSDWGQPSESEQGFVVMLWR